MRRFDRDALGRGAQPKCVRFGFELLRVEKSRLVEFLRQKRFNFGPEMGIVAARAFQVRGSLRCWQISSAQKEP